MGVILSPLCMPAPAAESDRRPNIIVILSDDMGYSDIGCFGGEINTPALNTLADGGLRFTQFYNTGRCCPTRAALLTGLYPHQAGIGWMMTDRGHDGYRGELNDRCRTIAEVLRPAGYSTYGVGKWHVTKHVSPEGPNGNWPLQRGFDRFYGTITGAGSFYDPGTLIRDNQHLSPLTDPEYQPEQYYYTHAISDHAVRFINEHAMHASDKPFFMYVAYTAAHWPMHALESDIARYKGRYDAGYDAIRQTRAKKLAKLGLLDPQWDITPTVGDWKSVEHREWELRCMEVYAAMIDSMDQGIGRIVNSLKDAGQFDNTLILFMQDNGGCQETIGRDGDLTRPVEPSLPLIAADAIRLDVIPKQNRAGVPTLMGPGIMPGPEDTYIAYGLNWANVSNTPFREYKHYVHEGGISTPLIAHWPAGLQRHGELEREPCHLIDIAATCADVAGAEYPATIDDRKIQPLEGVSLRPAFAAQPLGRGEPLFWEHEGNRAVRHGHWKLVAKENRPWELYDVNVDRTEMHDLAGQYPETVANLSAQWDKWAERANVLPLGTWRSQPQADSFNRKQRSFVLKQGDDLSRETGPFVEGRSLMISVAIKEFSADGVLVAQGGMADGYSLYLKDGAAHFATRHQGRLTVVASSQSVSPDVRDIRLNATTDGAITIEADGRTIATGQCPGPMARQPLDGLQVGRDLKGAVGEYPEPFEYSGQIAEVRIDVAPDTSRKAARDMQ